MSKKMEMKFMENFPSGWRAFEIGVGQVRPHSWRQWLRLVWGTDIWIFGVPFLKTMVAINVLFLALS